MVGGPVDSRSRFPARRAILGSERVVVPTGTSRVDDTEDGHEAMEWAGVGRRIA